jgi:hypothetical protein
MAKFCINKQYVEKFKQGLIDGLKGGELNPEKLNNLSSPERRALLEKYVGKENAHQVNALFESKLLLKNQKAGYIAWAKKVSGVTPEVRRDLIAKIERLDTVLDPKSENMFLEDLASSRLGFGIKADEAKQIFDISKRLEDAKSKITEDSPKGSKERLAYGLEQYNLEQYVNDLKLKDKKIYFKEQPFKYATQPIKATPGLMKSLLSSMDDSFFGRQGIKTLLDLRTSKIWVKDFLKSFKDIGNELKGTDAMALIKADVLSRPNALNGKYKALGKNAGLDVFSEEAFPSSLPERIPVLKRLYKASQSAYNGGALRMRADLADRLIAQAEKQGINVLDKTQGQGIGDLIGSMTGRGSLGRAEGIAQPANALFFSIKFVKSNLDTLTAHQFSSTATEFTKKEARKNLLSMVGTVAGVLAISEYLNPGSTDTDPRSTNFGKVKIFGRWTDITGGLGSMVTLASRITPTVHNGEWGFWTKTTSGYKKLNDPGYGKDSALDTFENFLEGKFSPGLGVVRDAWKGQNYSGDSIDVGKPKEAIPTLIKGNISPITGQTVMQMMKDPGSSNILASTILESIGLSTSPTTYPKNWNQNPGAELKQFKEKIGADKFNEANDKYNLQYANWLKSKQTNSDFKALSDEDKQALLSKAQYKIKADIFKSYGFEFQKAKPKSKADKARLDKYLP